MSISFAITVSVELEEIKRLIPFLLKHKNKQDEIVILFDEKNGSTDVNDFLDTLIDVNLHKSVEFNYDFAEWKNKLNSYCVGDFIFQLDADELITEYMVKGIGDIISHNKTTDLFFLPRTNLVDGITQEHIEKWGWRVDDLGRINHPDFQGRVYRNGMMWQGKVHEKIVGFKHYSLLPSEEIEYNIQHFKSINKQEKQNDLYKKI